MSERDFDINEAVNSIAEEINVSPTQVVLNWEMQQSGIVSPVLGARNVAHLEEQVHALSFTLSKDHLQRLSFAAQFDLGFPLDFIGTSYDSCPWVNWKAPPP